MWQALKSWIRSKWTLEAYQTYNSQKSWSTFKAKALEGLVKFLRSDFLANCIVIIIYWAVALIPCWVLLPGARGVALAFLVAFVVALLNEIRIVIRDSDNY